MLRTFHENYPQKDVWCYTGYLLEDLLEGGKVHINITDELLSYIDILVDGPFLLEQKDIRLKFRGSTNQRIINMNKTRKSKKVVLWDEK